MPDIADLAAICAAFFVVTVSPGPANIAVATVSMSAGRRSGMLFGVGLGVGLAFWGVVASTGLGALLQSSSQFLIALKIAGGLYLLWLAYLASRSAARPVGELRAAPPGGRWLRRGVLLNLSNPKAVVAWMAALSVGLGADDGIAEVFVATACCILIGFANYAGYAVIFSAPGAMSIYRRIGRWVDGAVAGLFALAGLSLIRSAWSRS